MSGPIQLPQEDPEHDQGHREDQGPGLGDTVMHRLRGHARASLFSTRAETTIRATMVPVAVVASVLLGFEWGLHASDAGYSVGFLAPWFSVLANAAHLLFQPLLGDLLAALERDLASKPRGKAALRTFRDRVAVAAFWADMFTAAFLFAAAVAVTCYSAKVDYYSGVGYSTRRAIYGSPRRVTVAGAVLLYLLSFLTVAVNTGVFRQIARIRVQFSLADAPESDEESVQSAPLLRDDDDEEED